MIRYERPQKWIVYDLPGVAQELAEAKAAVIALQTMPFQRSWVESLQRMELKMEVAGTSRIEGADFTDRELDAVLSETAGQVHTRSQRQALAALNTYVWIRSVPNDRPITKDLVCEIHRRIVTGADDDHCPPGQPRDRDENVNFGQPRHRGCEGGECEATLDDFTASVREDYLRHDPLIPALAAHYHVAAMHPFLDGNGRTARALEALMLQRAGLRDHVFIAMSNYYYDEKTAYLSALAAVRAHGHDLTPFLRFALRGVRIQVMRLLTEIQREMQKVLFKDTAYALFGRLRTPKRRAIMQRQMQVLQILLDASPQGVDFRDIEARTQSSYLTVKNPIKALVRDINGLIGLNAITWREDTGRHMFTVRLQWPTEITETEFFRQLRRLPHAKTFSFRRPPAAGPRP